jgi:hypothetical protein
MPGEIAAWEPLLLGFRTDSTLALRTCATPVRLRYAPHNLFACESALRPKYASLNAR